MASADDMPNNRREKMENADHFTVTLVLATNEWGTPTTVQPSICKREYGYTAVSEPLTITFQPLPKDVVIAAQLDVLDAQEEQLRSELADKLAGLNARRAELLALPAPEAA